MTSRSSSTVGIDVLVRAAGISLIVFGHALAREESVWQLLAGLNVLLLVAGYSFPRFLPSDFTSADIRRAFFRYGKAIAIPCLLAMIASQLVYWRISLLDLTFFANFFTAEHVAFFPAWYGMVIVQIALLLAAVFSVPMVVSIYKRWPFVTALVMVMAAFALRPISFRLWDSGYLDDRLPHLMLWNFLAGWLLYAAKHGRSGNKTPRYIALAIVIGLALLAWGPHLLRFWSTAIAAVALIFARSVSLPFLLGRAASIVSQASLTIFLFHSPLLRLSTPGPSIAQRAGDFAIAMVGSILIWIVATSCVRAYATLTTAPRADDRPQPA